MKTHTRAAELVIIKERQELDAVDSANMWSFVEKHPEHFREAVQYKRMRYSHAERMIQMEYEDKDKQIRAAKLAIMKEKQKLDAADSENMWSFVEKHPEHFHEAEEYERMRYSHDERRLQKEYEDEEDDPISHGLATPYY